MALVKIFLMLGSCGWVLATTSDPPNYARVGIAPMPAPPALASWMQKIDTLPTEPNVGPPSISSGGVMVSCENPTPPLVTPDTPICYATSVVNPPLGDLQVLVSDAQRLALVQYFSLRFGLQMNVSFFNPRFFDASYNPPNPLSTTPSNGPSVFNAYSACIRSKIYSLQGRIQASVPRSVDSWFTDPFTAPAKATLLATYKLSAAAELASAQRLAKFIDYVFPDAYPWQMLLVATGNDSKCGN